MEAYVKEVTTKNKVVLFSKESCPYCIGAKKLLDSIQVSYFSVELNHMGEQGKSIQKYLETSTKLKGVPNVWVNGEHYGDDGDIENGVKDGSLKKKLG